MILQNRDLEILHFINKFGYVSTDHIAKLFSMTKPRVSHILNRLKDDNYIKSERILVNKPAIHLLRTKGTELIKANRVKKVSLQNLTHNLCVIDVYVDLILEKPELNIKSDRELRAGIKFTKKKRNHMPDLIIETEELNGKKNIAIEVELTKKSKDRLKSISFDYRISLNYAEVAYYCSSSAYGHVRKHLSGSDIKIYNYFADESKQTKPNIPKVVEKISSMNSDKVKSLERELRESEREKENTKKEFKRLEELIHGFKRMYESVSFKKATFGNSYSLSGEELERINKFLSGF